MSVCLCVARVLKTRHFCSTAVGKTSGLLTLNKTFSRTLSKFVVECQGCSEEFWVLVSLPTPTPPNKKNAHMGKTKGVTAFGDARNQTGSWRSCRPLVFTEAHTESLECPLDNHRSTAISWTQQQQHVCCYSICVWVSNCRALECVFRMCVCVRICMQSCVKFACRVHLYVCVCVWWQQAD